MIGPHRPADAFRSNPDAFTPEAIVTEAYAALLGRAPEADGLRSHAEAIRTRGIAYVLRRILDSEEALRLSGDTNRIKLAFAGNCNVPVLASCLGTCGRVMTRWQANVTGRGTLAYSLAVEALESGVADYVISQPIYTFEELLTSSLSSRYGERFISYTAIHFDGLHPDMQQGSLGLDKAWRSPLGEWHSGIVLACYLQGLPARDCQARFQGKTYERLGYFDAFEKSAEALRQRDQGLTIQFSADLIEMARQEMSLLTLNHPTSNVFAALAARVCDAIGLGRVPFDPRSFDNELYDGPVWPIYAEIGEAHGLRYGTPFRFKPPGKHEPEIGLETFVQASYAQYDAYDRPAMRERFAPYLEWDV